MVRRFLALLALLLACAAGGGTASASPSAPVAPVAVTSQAHGHSGPGGQTSSRSRQATEQHAAGVSAMAPHEVRPPLLPPAHTAGPAPSWAAPPLTGRIAAQPRKGRAPPSVALSPRSTRGPPAATSS
ncbi:hypothetical protein GCM10009801_06410 [Streptomyces albiaxialis]|uniref:Lipoprotein n=1 Tax=Streptomyces albiaxialis TaxID=329523 RepID=A0ABN2VI05_9ACTN